MPQPPKNLKELSSLIRIIADLRGPNGCPWDLEQTHQSLTPYAIEEVHEFVEAVENSDDQHMCEELGDVLFQVVLHSQLAAERKKFDLADVIEKIAEKIVRRHPHVFSDVKVANKDEVLFNWDEIKKQEKAGRPKKSLAIDIPSSLPALQRAGKIGEKTKALNFDWIEIKDVIAQLKAELVELEEALQQPESPQKKPHILHEMGDVLFSAAQLARHLNIEPEHSLREANRRFLKRFEKMLELRNITAEEFTSIPSEEKEKLWSDAKKDC